MYHYKQKTKVKCSTTGKAGEGDDRRKEIEDSQLLEVFCFLPGVRATQISILQTI